MQTSSAITIPSGLSDDELVNEVGRLAGFTRGTTATLVAHLAEFEGRRLHLGAGYPSLFIYCTDVLRLSEHEAYHRIEAARLVRRFPAVLQRLADGALTLTTARLLSSQLTAENHDMLLAAAAGKSKRQVAILLASMFPLPDVPSSIRKVPAPRSVPLGAVGSVNAPKVESIADSVASLGTSSASEDSLLEWVDATAGSAGTPVAGSVLALVPSTVAECPVAPMVAGSLPEGHPTTLVASPPPVLAKPRQVIRPLAADRYEIRFTARAATREKLQMASDLLRHAVPDGDVAEIVDRALAVLLEDLAKRKFAATARPASSQGEPKGATTHSRHVPAKVKRAVWLRDGGRCAFVSKDGGREDRRCRERAFIEFHHVRPYGVGGEATAENIQLRCRAHNGYEAEIFYGSRFVPASERQEMFSSPAPGRSQLGPDRAAVQTDRTTGSHA